ncbi:NACHT, LRR and PYD domains-containing protein 1 homolog isoform X2 [Misgurnus anguillicaudatus]|uniref:NACHT, LRR and PYD domains-containing protein 1 homolog isoform X2 n=1 Tax=Misgurnus anguillicaudatus TaxID=75329 RepID=UPI003CCF5A41
MFFLEWTKIVDEYKMSMKEKYIQHKHDHFLLGQEASLADLYTEPDIIQKSINGGFRKISVKEMFRLNNPKTVTLQGNPGSGKSFLAQKIMLDWASGEHYLIFDLVFYLKYEELMCISEEINVSELLSWSSNLPSNLISEMIFQSSCNMLFLIDGFDEHRLMCYDYCLLHYSMKAPPDVIVCALLRKEIHCRSSLLVMTRTKVKQGTVFKRSLQSPYHIKIMGFSEKKIEEYFQKFFQDEEIFRKAYESVKSNETLLTACSVPVICWMICTVIKERVNDDANLTRVLETTTSIYVDFLSTVLEHHCQGLNESVPNLLRSLGQLAERGMLEQQVLFDEKTINETVQDPVNNPFLNKFLLEKRIQQETMFRFIHLSFQEFFTALYFVLLDEDESQKKVRELLHTVARGWALSCWSVAKFSNRDLELRNSKQLQSVILFLCGLCKNEMIDSIFKKHNVTVSINIKTQLKEWIHQCLLRYQHKNMMFILRCLYALHEKSFIGKVLGDLVQIDLSKTPLNKTDCWVLWFCLQCCEGIRNLRLNVTSDHLKILQPALCSCEELWLMVDDFSEDVETFLLALGERNILNQLIVKMGEKRSQSYSEIIASVKDGDLTLSVSCCKRNPRLSESPQVLSELTFTCSRSEISSCRNLLQTLQTLPSFGGSGEGVLVETVTVTNALQSLSGLKKVHLEVDKWTDEWISVICSLIQTCPSLNKLKINTRLSFIPLLVTLKESLRLKGWTMTVCRKSMLIERVKKRDRKSLTDEEPKTKERENEDESLDSVSCVPLGAKSSSTAQTCLEDADVFTPKYIDQDETKGTNTHRFVSPHAGQFQCSLTNLVFVMEVKGEVLYKIVPWDPRLLDGLGQMQPAGPLYNIDCFKGSISQLHLPHCEILSEKSKDSLAVAHFSDGNVEILQSIKVSSTHVIINITEFSLFGLIKKKIFPVSSVYAQVLLFLRPKSFAQKQKILNVHLLPGNVPLSEVQSQHQEKTYIETSSICHLIPGKEYKLCCHPEECEVQPPDEVFDCNFGPNFHTTFEVFLNVSIDEVRLGLLDSNNKGKEVWKQRRVLLSAPAQGVEPPVGRRFTESEFLDKHRDQLIQRVTSVMEIADCLMSKYMITSEMYKKVHSAEPRQEKMRIVFDVLDSGGSAVKSEFWRLLKEKEPHLVDELESELSNAKENIKDEKR